MYAILYGKGEEWIILETCAVLSALVSFFIRQGYMEKADVKTKGIPTANRKESFLSGFK